MVQSNMRQPWIEVRRLSWLDTILETPRAEHGAFQQEVRPLPKDYVALLTRDAERTGTRRSKSEARRSCPRLSNIPSRFNRVRRDGAERGLGARAHDHGDPSQAR